MTAGPVVKARVARQKAGIGVSDKVSLTEVPIFCASVGGLQFSQRSAFHARFPISLRSGLQKWGSAVANGLVPSTIFDSRTRQVGGYQRRRSRSDRTLKPGDQSKAVLQVHGRAYDG
jgi:hypothetical protein